MVLGREVMRLFDLELLDEGYYKGYSAKIDPSVANAFSTAAFRFGHSLIQDSFMRCDADFRFLPNSKFKGWLSLVNQYNSLILADVTLHEEQSGLGDKDVPGSLPRIIRGQMKQRAQKRDEYISEELTQKLFQTSSKCAMILIKKNFALKFLLIF